MKQLTKEALNTIDRLEKRINGVSNHTPAFPKLSGLLQELEIDHEIKEVIHFKDTKHSRNGNLIKKGDIPYRGFYLKINELEILSSDAVYRRNPYRYIKQIKEIIDNKLKENEKN